MVVVLKKAGDVRICVDFTMMNESVCREKFILPSVEHTLGMLAGATVFSKLDANMGFWQVPSTKESNAPLSSRLLGTTILTVYPSA